MSRFLPSVKNAALTAVAALAVLAPKHAEAQTLASTLCDFDPAFVVQNPQARGVILPITVSLRENDTWVPYGTLEISRESRGYGTIMVNGAISGLDARQVRFTQHPNQVGEIQLNFGRDEGLEASNGFGVEEYNLQNILQRAPDQTFDGIGEWCIYKRPQDSWTGVTGTDNQGIFASFPIAVSVYNLESTPQAEPAGEASGTLEPKTGTHDRQVHGSGHRGGREGHDNRGHVTREKHTQEFSEKYITGTLNARRLGSTVTNHTAYQPLNGDADMEGIGGQILYANENAFLYASAHRLKGDFTLEIADGIAPITGNVENTEVYGTWTRDLVQANQLGIGPLVEYQYERNSTSNIRQNGQGNENNDGLSKTHSGTLGINASIGRVNLGGGFMRSIRTTKDGAEDVREITNGGVLSVRAALPNFTGIGRVATTQDENVYQAKGILNGKLQDFTLTFGVEAAYHQARTVNVGGGYDDNSFRYTVSAGLGF